MAILSARLDTPALDAGSSLARGLLAWFPMRPAGGSTLVDLGPSRSLHGTLVNAPAWAAGPLGPGLRLVAASDQYVSLGNPAALQVTGAITIACRYRLATAPADLGGYQLVAKDGSSGGRAYTMDVNRNASEPAQSGARLYINGGGDLATNMVAEGRIPQAGDERVAVATYEPGVRLRLYIDGRLASANSGATIGGIPTATAPVLIGRRSYSGFENPLDGRVDAVAIWGRALSADEVAAYSDDPIGSLAGPKPSSRTVVLLGGASGGVGASAAVVAYYNLRRRA